MFALPVYRSLTRFMLLVLAILCIPLTGTSWAVDRSEIVPPDTAVSEAFGAQIVDLGDIDGDGVTDIAVSDPQVDLVLSGDTTASSDVGAVYVYSGDDLSLIYTLTGTTAQENFGRGLASGGDFDGDGSVDLAVGSPLKGDGEVTVYDAATGDVIETLTVVRSFGRFGNDLDFVGDIPFAGTHPTPVDQSSDDLVVGAPGDLVNQLTGRAFLFGMKTISDGMGGEIDVVDSHTIFASVINCCDPDGLREDGFARQVSRAGDFDGDSTPDIAFGTPNARISSSGVLNQRGRAFVLSGADLTTILMHRVGNAPDDRMGTSVQFVGDFASSGQSAVMIGSPNFDSGAGRVQIVAYNAADSTGELLLEIDGGAGDTLPGPAAFLGDVDGDGLDDALVHAAAVGTPGTLIFAGGTATDVPEDLATTDRLLFDGAAELGGDSFADDQRSFAADVDDDGSPDLLISDFSAGIEGGGRVFVYVHDDLFPATPPTNVVITGPVDGDILNGNVILSASADGATDMEFILGGEVVGVDSGAPFSVTFDSETFVLGDGTFEFVVSATNDGSGATESDPIFITIDNTSPDIAITTPADGDHVADTIDFTATAVDPNGIVEVIFEADGMEVGRDSDNDPGVLLDTTTLSDGTVTLTIIAEDTLGNQGTTSIDVVVDNLDPEVTFTSHLDEEYVSGTLELAAVATDTNLEKVIFRVDGVEIGEDSDGSDGFTASFDTVAEGVPDGGLGLEVEAVDLAGNSVESGVTVIVDNTFPEKVLKRPGDGRRVNRNMTILAHAEDEGSGIDSVRVFVDGELVGESAPGADFVRIASYDTRDHLDGPLEISCEAEDVAGNITTDLVTVIVNNWRKRLIPRKIKSSSPGSGPVRLQLSGSSIGLLLDALQGPTPPTVELRLGGQTIALTGHSDSIDEKNRLFVDFDRVDYLAMALADLTDRGKTQGTVRPEVLLDGVVIDRVKHIIRK